MVVNFRKNFISHYWSIFAVLNVGRYYLQAIKEIDSPFSKAALEALPEAVDNPRCGHITRIHSDHADEENAIHA